MGPLLAANPVAIDTRKGTDPGEMERARENMAKNNMATRNIMAWRCFWLHRLCEHARCFRLCMSDRFAPVTMQVSYRGNSMIQ